MYKHFDKIKQKKGSYRYVVMRSAMLFFAVFAMFTTIYILAVGRNERQKEAVQRSERWAIQISAYYDGIFRNFESYYASVTESPEIDFVMKNQMSYLDEALVERIQKMLDGGGLCDAFVDDYVFIDTDIEYVICSDGAYPREEYVRYDEYSSLMDKYPKVKKFWDKDEIGTLRYVVKLPADTIKSNALFVLEIDTGSCRGIANQLILGPEKLFVFNEAGSVVFSNAGAERLEYQDTILNALNSNKALNIPNEGKYILRGAKSSINDWNYVVLCPLDNTLYFGNTMTFIGAILLVILACTLFLISMYSMYRPVNLLFKKVGSGEQSNGNEFEYIENRLSNLTIDKDNLQETISRQQVSIQQMFELHLINDGIRSEEEWDDYFEKLNLPKYDCFATTVTVLDVRYDSHIQQMIDEDAICLQLIEDMPEELGKLLWMPPVYNSCTIFSLIGANNEDELFARTNEYFAKMQEYCKKKTGFYVIMGVSDTYREHKKIRRAYRESAMALMYNENKNQDYHEIEQNVLENGVDTSQSLRFYVDKLPSESNHPNESYNTKYENDVQIAVKETDTQKAYKCTDRFSEFLLTVKTDEAMFYILRYVDHIVMTALESNISIDEIFPNGIRATYRELIAELEPRRVRGFIKRCYIDPVIACMNEHMQNGSHHIMEQIDALLDETHGNILLSECADKLDLNQNYIWKVLKMERGKGFTEYAEKRKIEEAKKLLTETNMSVQEIAASLDYANAQNFIRFFSKATGITPGKFRKMY